MYDNDQRARLVCAALKEAYASKMEAQKAEEQKRRREIGGAANDSLAEFDLVEVSSRLEAIGVHVTGLSQRDDFSMELLAEFRGVEVTVVLPVQLDCDVNGDPALIELQARDFMLMEYGAHSWTRALPLNELDVKDGACQLDAISLTIRHQTVHALLLERPISTAAGFFEALADEWQGCPGWPSDDLLDRTIIALRAQVQLLASVHGRNRSFGGDPLVHLHLSQILLGKNDGRWIPLAALGCLQELCPDQLPFLVLTYKPCCKQRRENCSLLQSLLTASCSAVTVMHA